VLTVSELTNQIRSLLENRFPTVWVEGEISNLRRPPSGHQYFTLKDQHSQIRSVIFRGSAQQLRFDLQDGLEVIVAGRLTVYEPRGDYQLILESVEPKGIGALQLAFEQLKEKLAGEGLFDTERKRPLPFFPRKIGIVTSLQGAAVRDMLTILKRRCPIAHILVHPVLVQGEGAAGQIADAIHTLNRMNLDVLIVGRGGGSLEDLWCFNEEVVVRAIAESAIPVISAVGHETDVTLADFAADYRAPTPSAAAEIVVPQLDDLFAQMEQLNARIQRAMRTGLDRLLYQVGNIKGAMPDPVLWFYRYSQHLDDLELRLHQALQDLQKQSRLLLLALQANVFASTPSHFVRENQRIIPQLEKRTISGILRSLKEKQLRSEMMMTSLHNLSPLGILSRGYSVVETLKERKIVKSHKDVSIGASVRTRLAEGQLICLIQDTKAES
jgi:exodeoxyribonuclease VII large subunit